MLPLSSVDNKNRLGLKFSRAFIISENGTSKISPTRRANATSSKIPSPGLSKNKEYVSIPLSIVI